MLRSLYCLLALTTWAFALPSGGQVAQGQATLSPSSQTLQINANGKAILQWESFDIASHETVDFIQSQKGAILNRVMAGSASQILGTLQANCPIYFVNPQGVFIGANACIDTAGFLASTADISNEAFWQGTEMLFDQLGDGSILNLGTIRAEKGDCVLIARMIDNQGSMEARNGTAILTTHEVMLHPDTKECVYIRVDGRIQNSGKIEALAVELKTLSPYEKAINHTGVIEACELNGRIYLVAEEGGTIVDGRLIAEAGEIHVLGQTVLLGNGARIDAQSGGTILIGGDYQGKNPDILNAKKTFVASGAQIRADALENGNGGKVIVWSDEATFYYGNISVRGGEEGGDGGFVEVSGPFLEYGGLTDARAPFGKMGELLLDPNDVVIGGGPATPGTSFSACAPSSTFNFVNGTPTNQILNTALQTQLGMCSVTIDTSASGGIGPNNGSITVSSPVTWGMPTTLTLTAASFITVTAAVTNNSATPGFTAMNFTANGVGATTNPGILLSAGGILTTMGGNVTLNGTSAAVMAGSHGVFFNGGSIVTGGGNISVTGLVPLGVTGADIHGINMNTVNGMTSSSGGITLSGITNTNGNAGHGVRIQQNWVTGTTGTLTFTNCIGGIGTSPYGVAVFGGFLSTTGSIIATNNIQSGLGSGTGGSGGFSIVNPVSSTGGGNIQITASCTLATAGTGQGNGIQTLGFFGGSLSTTGNGTITLIGTGSVLSGTANGGVVIGSGSGGITTADGAINIAGHPLWIVYL